MEQAVVAPAPGYIDRIRAAWRGEESLGWVFLCYHVLVGLCLASIHVTILLVSGAFSGASGFQFSGTPVGQTYSLIFDVVQLAYLGIAFILFVRCISNVSWRGWHYAGLLFLLGTGYTFVERARDLGAMVLGG